MRSLLNRVQQRDHHRILRLGRLDPEVGCVTTAGKLRSTDVQISNEASIARERLNELAELLSHRTISNDRFQELYAGVRPVRENGEWR